MCALRAQVLTNRSFASSSYLAPKLLDRYQGRFYGVATPMLQARLMGLIFAGSVRHASALFFRVMEQGLSAFCC